MTLHSMKTELDILWEEIHMQKVRLFACTDAGRAIAIRAEIGRLSDRIRRIRQQRREQPDATAPGSI